MLWVALMAWPWPAPGGPGPAAALERGRALAAPDAPELGRALLLAKKERADKSKESDTAAEPAVEIRLVPARGFCDAPVEVAVTASTSPKGGALYYTTDGSVPSRASGTKYERPIPLHQTTTLRVAWIKGGKAEVIETHSYLFPTDLATQTGEGFPKSWGVNDTKPVPADYEMDPEIVGDPAYRDELVGGLKAIPTLSIVMKREDLFGAEQGIYAHPQESGENWERPCSVELIHPDGHAGFQVDCGVRIQGGWNRRPEESPKHSLRLLFKKKYGSAKLEFPLFGRDGVGEFSTLILRGGCNNTWLHWSGEERRRGDFIRDQWMRDSMGAMGHPTARGFFAHLFLNGLYWGLYNPSERPSAPFVAAHLGGRPKDYDSKNGEKALEGDNAVWMIAMELANGGLAGDSQFQSFQKVVDLPNLIDFLILNYYGANADWDRHSNWYAARRRNPPGRFLFFVWDGERTLEKVEDNTLSFDDDDSPPRLFQKLRENAEFRLQFADRLQRLCFGEGPLTARPAGARFRTWSDPLDKAIVLESARWGDYRRDVHPYRQGPYQLYTRNDHWRPEIKRLLEDYFPRRTAVLLEQCRAVGLYPRLAAPGAKQTDAGLVLATAKGTILFTRNGTDPRSSGGKVSPTASTYERPLTVVALERIKARAFDDSAAPAAWSALVEF